MRYQADNFRTYSKSLGAPNKAPPPAPVSGLYRSGVNYDPDREAVLEAIDASGLSISTIVREAGICHQTILNWRTGVTRRPCHMVMAAVLRVCGKEFRIVDIDRQ